MVGFLLTSEEKVLGLARNLGAITMGSFNRDISKAKLISKSCLYQTQTVFIFVFGETNYPDIVEMLRLVQRVFVVCRLLVDCAGYTGVNSPAPWPAFSYKHLKGYMDKTRQQSSPVLRDISIKLQWHPRRPAPANPTPQPAFCLNWCNSCVVG